MQRWYGFVFSIRGSIIVLTLLCLLLFSLGSFLVNVKRERDREKETILSMCRVLRATLSNSNGNISLWRQTFSEIGGRLSFAKLLTPAGEVVIIEGEKMTELIENVLLDKIRKRNEKIDDIFIKDGHKVILSAFPVKAWGEDGVVVLGFKKNNDIVHGVESMIPYAGISLILLTVGLLISRKVQRKFNSFANTFDALADGKIEKIEEEDRSVYEFTELARKWNKTTQKISSVIFQVSSVAENIKEVSRVISESSQVISGSSESLQKSISSIAENVEKFKTYLDETNQTLSHISNHIKDSTRFSLDGISRLESIFRKIQKLSEMFDEFSKVFLQLKCEVENIAKVVDSLEEIADKTTLLSLNASIESSRIGMGKRGFSVISSEIGKLAEKTMKELREIGNLTDKIMDEFSNVANFTQKVLEKFKSIVQVVQNVEGDLKKIKEIARKSENDITSLKNIFDSNLKLASRITDDLKTISKLANDFSSTVKPLEDTVSKLESLADDLKNSLKFFNGIEKHSKKRAQR